MTDAAALRDASRTFLARYEEALASGDPARGLAACDGILDACEATWPEEISRVTGAASAQLDARGVVERRIAELEGLGRQLKLAFHQLEAREVDVMRLVALLTATRRQLHAVSMTLDAWASAHGAPAGPAPGAFEALRAAREALVAGCAGAAHPAIREAALRAGVQAPTEGNDIVSGWRALDAVEAAIHRKQMGLS